MTRLFWLDVETTGLNRERDIVLAVGMRLTTTDLEVISEIDVVTPAWQGNAAVLSIRPEAMAMHELAKLYAPALLEGCSGKRDVHMPLADIDDAIALFRHLRAGMGLVKEAALCFHSP